MRIKATYVGLEIEFTRVQSKYTSKCQDRLWKCKAPGARPKRRAKLLAGLGESSTKHVFTKTAVVVATVTGDVGVGSFSSAQWCCRPATTLGRGSPSNNAACFGSRRWLIGLHSSPLGALPPASHKRYSRLGRSIWRSLLGSVRRQKNAARSRRLRRLVGRQKVTQFRKYASDGKDAGMRRREFITLLGGAGRCRRSRRTRSRASGCAALTHSACELVHTVAVA